MSRIVCCLWSILIILHSQIFGSLIVRYITILESNEGYLANRQESEF